MTNAQPWYEHAGVRLYCGDCRDVLRSLPDRSVQCVISSPPYFGLRDYGTAAWEGGDAGCDHRQLLGGVGVSSTKQLTSAGTQGYSYRDVCGKCGARRVDSQIGLEATPAAYVAEMVAVFREIRRVLRDDGCLFLNLGDSYFGSSMTGGVGKGTIAGTQQGARKGVDLRFTPNAGVRDALGHDNDGKASQGSLDHGSSSGSRGDGHRDSWWRRIAHSDSRHALAQVDESLVRIRACMAELHDRLPIADCSLLLRIGQSSSATLDQAKTASLAIERLRASLVSMPLESSPPPPEGFLLSDMISACLSSLHSFSACVRRCAHTSDASSDLPDCTAGNASLSEELAHHIRCTDGYCSLLYSWLNPPYVEPHCTTSRLKPKDLIGIPWSVAFALRDDGWYLRSEIIWHKPNPMPESVTDRPTRSHEYIFLLSKSAKYYYDADAIAEEASLPRLSGPRTETDGYRAAYGDIHRGITNRTQGPTRNKRDVWTVATQPYAAAHFATFPPKLIEPCILAGSPAGGVVLDPFAGAGTSLLVAKKHNRRAVGIELSESYCRLIVDRLSQDVLALDAAS